MNGPPNPFTRLAQKLIGEFRGIVPDEPEKMRRRPTQELGSLIDDLRDKHRIGRDAPEDAVSEAWPVLVGAANASYSHPVRIEGRRLVVAATHSVVRNELFLHRAEIVQRIQKIPGCKSVTELHIRAG